MRRNGIDVTRFSADEAELPRTLVPSVREQLYYSRIFERADEFDLIHNHFGYLPITFARLTQTPMITVLHGLLAPQMVTVYERYDPEVVYVSTSDADRHPELTYAMTIHPSLS